MRKKLPLVSVVIPSCNSEKTIHLCLASIKRQTYPNVEIIVVDNHSRDQTRTIARRYTSSVFIHGPERAAQLNYGASRAKGTYVYRVDSDFIVEPTVIAECVTACQRKNLDGIAVHNTSAEGLGFWAEVRKLERNSYRDDTLIVAVRFFTKRAWSVVGGMDESLYGPEDYDFHNRFVLSGFRWGRVNAIERHLGEPKSLADIWNKHFWYGKQMLFYFKKYPAISLRQFNPVRSSYMRHGKSFLEHPLLTVGLFVMIITKFVSGGLGFLSAVFSGYRPGAYQSK